PLSPSNGEMTRSCKEVIPLPDRARLGWAPPPARGPESGVTMGAVAAREIRVVAGRAGAATAKLTTGPSKGGVPPTEILRDSRSGSPAARTPRSEVSTGLAGVPTEWDT